MTQLDSKASKNLNPPKRKIEKKKKRERDGKRCERMLETFPFLLQIFSILSTKHNALNSISFAVSFFMLFECVCDCQQSEERKICNRWHDNNIRTTSVIHSQDYRIESIFFFIQQIFNFLSHHGHE